MNKIYNKTRHILRDYSKTAIICDGEFVSYRELLCSINAYSGLYNIEKGDRVMIFSGNRPEWIYAFYSVWLNKGIAVPADYTMHFGDLAEILYDCRPAVIFVSEAEHSLLKKLIAVASFPCTVLVFEDLKTIKTDLRCDAISISEESLDDTAMIMYTSGTTGISKGVMLSYKNLFTSVNAIAELDMIRESDIMVALLPFYHIFPLQGSVIAPFFAGVTMVFIKQINSGLILETLQKHKVTMFLGVPRLYEMFHTAILKKVKSNPAGRILLALARFLNSRRAGRFIFGKVHRAFGGHVHSYLTGGAKLDPAVARDLWALGFKLVEGYGTTETAPLISFNPHYKVKLGSAGKPVSGTEVKIEDGEIIVKGNNVMQGYYGRPRETSAVVADGWYHTGDTGYFDREGYLYVSGRKDEMIVLPNGKNFHPESVEKALLRTTDLILEAAVVYNNKKITAVLNPDFRKFSARDLGLIKSIIEKDVIFPFNNSLPHYRRILDLYIVKDELPKTRLGKLKRYLLNDVIKGKSRAGESGGEPDFEEYHILKKFLSDLKGSDVSFNDRFDFDLSLDSLDYLELINFMETAFGLSIQPESLVNYGTVESLAGFIKMSRVKITQEKYDWKDILVGSNKFSSQSGELKRDRLISIGSWIINRYFSIESSGEGNIPEGPCIFTPNHQSFLDVPVLGTVIPRLNVRRTVFVVKKTRFISPLVSLITMKKNIIILDAEKNVKESLQRAAAELKQGKKLLIFPEGIRSRDGGLLTFKKAFAILSRELDVPVVPVMIDGTFRALGYGSFVIKPARIRIRFGKPVPPAGRNYNDIVNAVRGWIETELKS